MNDFLTVGIKAVKISGKIIIKHFRKDFSFKAAIENFSRQLIRKALKISKYNKAKAAKLLKMDRSTLNYQIKILGINDERLN